MVIVRNTTVQNVANNTSVTLTANEEVYDSGGWFVPPSTSVSVPQAGIYTVFAWIKFPYSATGRRALDLLKNGILTQNYIVAPPDQGAGECDVSMTYTLGLSAGDTIGINAWQNSGVTMQVWFKELSVKQITPL